MQIRACQIRRPVYRHSTATMTTSSTSTEKVTVKQSPPLSHADMRAWRQNSAVAVGPVRLAALPPGTRGAFLALVAAISGQCVAGAHFPGPAAGQAVCQFSPPHLCRRFLLSVASRPRWPRHHRCRGTGAFPDRPPSPVRVRPAVSLFSYAPLLSTCVAIFLVTRPAPLRCCPRGTS
jgi:hypothetical protein